MILTTGNNKHSKPCILIIYLALIKTFNYFTSQSQYLPPPVIPLTLILPLLLIWGLPWVSPHPRTSSLWRTRHILSLRPEETAKLGEQDLHVGNKFRCSPSSSFCRTCMKIQLDFWHMWDLVGGGQRERVLGKTSGLGIGISGESYKPKAMAFSNDSCRWP